MPHHRFTTASLGDVITLKVADLIAASAFLNGCAQHFRVHAEVIGAGISLPPEMPMSMKTQFLKRLQLIGAFADEVGMFAAGGAARDAYLPCLHLLAPDRPDAGALLSLAGYAERVIEPLRHELKARQCFMLDMRHADLMEDRPQFGDAVAAAFPTATFDIAEAAKCRALGRWTASVMHLMRVLEIGLAALAQHLGIDAADRNWNSLLNEIEAKARTIGKGTHGADEAQWAAEAATHLRFIKNAWRNHAMHPLEKYDEERASAIYDNAAAFMRHLATQLADC